VIRDDDLALDAAHLLDDCGFGARVAVRWNLKSARRIAPPVGLIHGPPTSVRLHLQSSADCVGRWKNSL